MMLNNFISILKLLIYIKEKVNIHPQDEFLGSPVLQTHRNKI